MTTLQVIRDTVPLTVVVAFGTVALATARQTQMSEEVAVLHRSVFERPANQVSEDPALYRELALRYLHGQGVERDLVQACALLWRAEGAARSPRHDQAGVEAAEVLLTQHCTGLGLAKC